MTEIYIVVKQNHNGDVKETYAYTSLDSALEKAWIVSENCYDEGTDWKDLPEKDKQEYKNHCMSGYAYTTVHKSTLDK